MDADRLARYKSTEGAQSYNLRYTRQAHKRWNTAHEMSVIRKALRLVGPVPFILDLPCGAGRLYPALRETAPRFIEADISHQMLTLCRENLNGAQARFVNTSALEIAIRSN